MNKLKGTGVALITPFKTDGTVDTKALGKLVAYQKDNGIDYLVVLGTTGEYPTLDKDERSLVKRTVIEENDGQLPLVLGIGGNNTKAVVEQLQTEDTKGFDAILSVSPYYNKPAQEGIYKHFEQLADNTPLPLVLYNVPGRTGSNIQPDTLARLAGDFDSIVGVKEAGGDMAQAMEMIAKTPDDFHVISGEDILTLPMVLAGGSGVISVTAQGFPEVYAEMVRSGLKREVDAAYQLHYKLAEATGLVFEEGNPAGIKAVLKQRDISGIHTRLPLIPASEALREKISQFVSEF